jgi:hypothetical protein
MSTHYETVGAHQLNELRTMSNDTNLSPILHTLTLPSLFHITQFESKDLSCAPQRLLIGSTPATLSWTVLRQRKAEKQTVYVPRFYSENKQTHETIWLTRPREANGRKATLVVEVASLVPFVYYRQYARDLWPGHDGTPSVITTYEMLCSFVRYVFLQDAMHEQVHIMDDERDEIKTVTA